MNKTQLKDLLLLPEEQYNDNQKTKRKAILSGANAFAYLGSHILGKNLQNPIIQNNLNDVFLCASGYFLINQVFNKKSSAIMAFSGASFMEFLQRGNKGYDQKDFVAYAIGAGLAFSLDYLQTKQNP